MNKSIFSTLLLLFTLNLFASEKTCFYANGYDGTKGDRFQVSIALNQLIIKDIHSSAWVGTYTKRSSNVNGRDGRTYLNFDATGDEGCNTILVDTALLSNGTTGMIKFICRGEGFNQDSFFCRE